MARQGRQGYQTPNRLETFNYGGWKSACRRYEERLRNAPSPDHPSAINASHELRRAEANMIGWASR
jgi:hypothetical protein